MAGFGRTTLRRCIYTFLYLVGAAASIAGTTATAPDLSHMASTATPGRSVTRSLGHPGRYQATYAVGLLRVRPAEGVLTASGRVAPDPVTSCAIVGLE